MNKNREELELKKAIDTLTYLDHNKITEEQSLALVFIIEEAKRIKEYANLLEQGTSSYEARGIVWNVW